MMPCKEPKFTLRDTDMPSLFRFLIVVATIVIATYTGLYAVAVYFEPEPREVRKPIPGIQIVR